MTIPNMLTLVRIALVPIFMYTALSPLPQARLFALIIYIVASLTDSLDGYIARKYGQITVFGKFIDPLADKLLVTSALLIFVQTGELPAWAAMVVLARELAVTSLRMVAASDGVVIAAVFWGKLKMAVQTICIIALLAGFGEVIIYGGITIGVVATWAMVFVAVMSCYDYIKRNIHIIAKGIKQEGAKK